MITGKSYIGNQLSAETESFIQAFDPKLGIQLEEKFFAASSDEINQALDKATMAFDAYAQIPGRKRAEFLDAIAEEILNLGDELIQRACAESGLPEGRITGERGRTVGQLKMFAELLREGSWVESSIDTAQPDRAPIPKPDIRTMLVPVGPVVVFSASNFPLAFSTAGGDTASALAAGNPVIVKAHESHPGTNELVASAIIKAVQSTGMPDGTFSSLNGIGHHLGASLVKHPHVKSVAFTGSFRGGKALYDIAAQREEPIPVFAEMGSVNPVVVFPNKIETEGTSLAGQLAGSITLGAGQFCTNPGLIFVLDSEESRNFVQQLSEGISNSVSQTMLNEGIQKNYLSKVSDLSSRSELSIIAQGPGGEAHTEALSTIAQVTGADFIENPHLHEEIFGPFSLIVSCASKEELRTALHAIKGQLTTTAMCTDIDVQNNLEVLDEMKEVAGRLIFNGVPTGVEVCHSMHHGGPYPATTDSRFTSVGTEAIKRFVRPLCFQNSPQSFLPKELQDGNPLGIWRKVNGSLSKD